MAEKQIIGWQEWVQLPKLSIPAVKVKIDTGAKTSSLHAEEIEYFKKNNKDYVRFIVHPLQRDKKIRVACEAPLAEHRHVTSSSGTKENRPVIKTKICLGKFCWNIELNLTKRDYMGLRMLLGREAMRGHLLVDSEETFLHGKIKNAQIRELYK